MGNHLKIIDFVGLPGCGKSSCSHELAKILLANNEFVDELTYDMDHTHHPYIRYFFKTFYTFLFALKHSKDAHEIDLIIKKYASRKNLINSLKRNLFYKLYLIRSRKSKRDSIIIMDEGLAQTAITLSMGTESNPNTILLEFLKFIGIDIEYLFVYLKSDIKVALNNMASRSSCDSSVEKLRSNEEKLMYMNLFQEKLSTLHPHSFLEFSAYEYTSPQETALKIYNSIY